MTGGRRSTWTASSKSVENKSEERPRKKFGVFSRSKINVSEDTTSRHTIKESLCWPETLLPSIISNCRIMTWGYDADVTHFFKPASGSTTFQHAQNLLAELERHRRDLSEVGPFTFTPIPIGLIRWILSSFHFLPLLKWAFTAYLAYPSSVISSRPRCWAINAPHAARLEQFDWFVFYEEA